MSVFPTAGHLASWAGQCPGNDQSAGKRRSGRTRKGSKWLDVALKDAALAAIRTDGSYLQALYRRKKPQLQRAPHLRTSRSTNRPPSSLEAGPDAISYAASRAPFASRSRCSIGRPTSASASARSIPPDFGAIQRVPAKGLNAYQKARICGPFLCGRYWARTSDPQLVEPVGRYAEVRACSRVFLPLQV